MVYFLINRESNSSDYYIRRVSSDIELLEKRKERDIKNGEEFSEIYDINKVSSLYFNDDIENVIYLFNKFLFFPVYELKAIIKSKTGSKGIVKTVMMTLNESSFDNDEVDDILSSLKEHMYEKMSKFNETDITLKCKHIGYDMFIPSGQSSYSTLDLGQTDEELKESFSNYVKLHSNKTDDGYLSSHILEYPLVSEKLKIGYSIESIDRFTYFNKDIINIKFQTK